jgi:CTP synthase
LIPFLSAAKELKTKPTQHSVKQLSETGVSPDILVCRSEHKLPQDIRKKLALFCNVHINSVIEAIAAERIDDVPILMRKEKLDERVLTKLKLPHKIEPNLEQWQEFLVRLKSPSHESKIALVGKYVELPDAYKSIVEAFIHAGAVNDAKVEIKWVAAEDITKENAKKYLKDVDGVLVVPGL